MRARYDRGRLRIRLQDFQFPRLFRLIHRDYRDGPLRAAPVPSRFSDPSGQFTVLYAAETVRCVFWEALARNRFNRQHRYELPLAEAEGRVVVSIQTNRPLALIDLRGDGPVRIGAPTAVAHDSNHAAGRALSAAVHSQMPEADGFVFPSRFTGHTCVAVFDRAFGKLEAIAVTRLVEHFNFQRILDDYDITLSIPPS